MDIYAILISIFCSLVSGVLLYYVKRYFKQRDSVLNRNNEARHRESVLLLKSIKVLGELTEANSIAIRDGKTNGELKRALADYKEVDEELYDFLLEQSTQK